MLNEKLILFKLQSRSAAGLKIIKLMDAKKNRPFRLRTRTVEDLRKSLGEHRAELASLRVNKVASGVASKLAKIRVVRKAVARHLTIINQKRRQELKNAFSSRAGIRKYNEEHKTTFALSHLPKELRPRKTRALRRKLTQHQASRVLPKIRKAQAAFPQRKFALKA